MTTLEQSAILIGELRRDLDSISLEELQLLNDPQLTDEELTARAGDAEIFYKNHFKKILDLLIYRQQINIIDTAKTIEQLLFVRGTLNGFYLIEEWFGEQVGLSVSRFDKEEKSEPGEIV